MDYENGNDWWGTCLTNNYGSCLFHEGGDKVRVEATPLIGSRQHRIEVTLLLLSTLDYLESPKSLVSLRRVLVRCLRAHDSPEIKVLSDAYLQMRDSVCQSLSFGSLVAREK